MGLDMGWAPNVPFARVPLVVGIGAITDKVIPVNGAPAVSLYSVLALFCAACLLSASSSCLVGGCLLRNPSILFFMFVNNVIADIMCVGFSQFRERQGWRSKPSPCSARRTHVLAENTGRGRVSHYYASHAIASLLHGIGLASLRSAQLLVMCVACLNAQVRPVITLFATIDHRYIDGSEVRAWRVVKPLIVGQP